MTIRFKFLYKRGKWYYEIPDQKKGTETSKTLAEANRYGVDTFIQLISADAQEVVLDVSTETDNSKNEIILQKIEEHKNGAQYLLREYNGKPYVLQISLTERTLDFFGYLPDLFYVRKVEEIKKRTRKKPSK